MGCSPVLQHPVRVKRCALHQPSTVCTWVAHNDLIDQVLHLVPCLDPGDQYCMYGRVIFDAVILERPLGHVHDSPQRAFLNICMCQHALVQWHGDAVGGDDAPARRALLIASRTFSFCATLISS